MLHHCARRHLAAPRLGRSLRRSRTKVCCRLSLLSVARVEKHILISATAIRSDGMDPDAMPTGFSQRLHEMGIVNPQPTFSPTSTAISGASPTATTHLPSAVNATLTVLEARRSLQRAAEADFESMGRKGSRGRQFVDVATAVRVLGLRERGTPVQDIEARFGLKPGVVAKIGRPNVVVPAELGRA